MKNENKENTNASTENETIANNAANGANPRDCNNGANPENPTNLQTIVVIGSALGDYHNEDVSKEFAGEMLALIRPNGSVIVQNLSQGIRPICYIGSGAETSMSRNMVDSEIELIASTDDGQYLSLRFEEVHGLCGVPGKQDIDSLALTILRSVSEMNGRYGRIRIARLLSGSTSKCVLTMGIDELRSYGVARGLSQKEILILIDWLIDEEYLSIPEDVQYPTLHITPKGDETLEDFETGADIRLGNIHDTGDAEDMSLRFEKLREWRRIRSGEIGVPLYIVLQNKTIEDLAIKNPQTMEDLKEIYGIGEVKASTYGEEILGILGEGVA